MNNTPAHAAQNVHAFTQEAHDAVYQAIFSRRCPPRLPMEDLVYFDQWGQRDDQQPLMAHLQRDQAAAQNLRQTLAAA